MSRNIATTPPANMLLSSLFSASFLRDDFLRSASLAAVLSFPFCYLFCPIDAWSLTPTEVSPFFFLRFKIGRASEHDEFSLIAQPLSWFQTVRRFGWLIWLCLWVVTVLDKFLWGRHALRQFNLIGGVYVAMYLLLRRGPRLDEGDEDGKDKDKGEKSDVDQWNEPRLQLAIQSDSSFTALSLGEKTAVAGVLNLKSETFGRTWPGMVDFFLHMNNAEYATWRERAVFNFYSEFPQWGVASKEIGLSSPLPGAIVYRYRKELR